MTDHEYQVPDREPMRTIDRPDDGPARAPTPDARAALEALVNRTDDQGNVIDEPMAVPHAGPRFSQRQLARKVLAGRSYQAVQHWLNGEPVPKTTAEWLLEDLVRIDARGEARSIVLQDDEVAIVVKR